MHAFPEPVIVQDALLGSLLPNVQPAGVGMIAHTRGHKLEYYRASTPDGLCDWAEITPPESAPVGHFAGDTLYGGPFIEHFGHMLAEWMHRLWANVVFADKGFDRIVFQTFPGQGRPGWVDEVLRACGADPAKVLFLSDLHSFERLHVPKQGRVLGGVTMLEGYRSLFPLAPIPIDTESPRNVYVSRARHIQTGTYLGESLVEQVLARHGFAVVHPESTSLPALLSLIRSASAIVFTEGSAIHNLELIGAVEAKVLVIGRRHGAKHRFGTLLDELAPSAAFFGNVEPLPALAWDGGRPRTSEACSLVPIGELLDRIGSTAGVAIASPSQVEIDRAVMTDLARYLLHPLSGAGATDEAIGHGLRRMRDHKAMAALIADRQEAEGDEKRSDEPPRAMAGHEPASDAEEPE